MLSGPSPEPLVRIYILAQILGWVSQSAALNQPFQFIHDLTFQRGIPTDTSSACAECLLTVIISEFETAFLDPKLRMLILEGRDQGSMEQSCGTCHWLL